MSLRRTIRAATFADETALVADLQKAAGLSLADRKRISARGAQLVRDIRDGSDPSIMELFLGEYGLSSEEGVALMCLAEALLRVPDTATIDDLIEDKIVPNEWSAHLGQSHSPLINASTWALMLTGRVLDDDGVGIAANLRGLVKRLGEPVIRTAVARAMREMGRQFVLGEKISSAMVRAKNLEDQGFTYSYDMLGEAAKTEADASRYHVSYARAISEIAKAAPFEDISKNPGISIKLSALHPRYEPLQRDRMIAELVPRVMSLVTLAKSAGIGLNIDAEEAARLDLSLDIIDAVLSDPALAGWDGFGVVVQAYSKRAGPVIDWLFERAAALDRKIMVRLVKGAYWDTEIKLSQVDGLPGFPVFTRKAATDISYLACARKLFDYAERIYPQFATHNAHTVAAVLDMAPSGAAFEFQRLHGMGESLHKNVMRAEDTRCRIYAPVGAHEDLLAYLVRRLLENGANSSFVNQITDETVSADIVAADPMAEIGTEIQCTIAHPVDLFAPHRRNSLGYDLGDPEVLIQLIHDRDTSAVEWKPNGNGSFAVINPATGAQFGALNFDTPETAKEKMEGLKLWRAPAKARAKILRRAAALYEANSPELFALLAQEAGKTLWDCIGEVREAVDFLRYYADEGERLSAQPLGTIVCISPWNFPLAIFTGQIAAGLAVGNAVAAKPAEATSLIARRAIDLLYQAGVPKDSLSLICGEGPVIGPVLCAHPNTAGVVFTGSTATGQAIHKVLAAHRPADTPMIAETGGINAMIVDSTALLEQAVEDIVTSAFQSAGQRCSALRVLYVQSDVVEALKEMLFGAMDALVLGDPMNTNVDVGPVIDTHAKVSIDSYVAGAVKEGRLLKQVNAPSTGSFVAPAVIQVHGIADVTKEVFGPVLHLAAFDAADLDQVVAAINATGFGLTFGLHSRIDSRVQRIVDRIDVGNIYINRNQIGAVVGSQPFGGHGLSGTGPKAGGPRYLRAFCKSSGANKSSQNMPGPTGETNTYSIVPRRGILCTGPGLNLAAEQARLAKALGCKDVIQKPNATPLDVVEAEDLSVVLHWGNPDPRWRVACAQRSGPICALVTDRELERHLTLEKLVCIDTTASGGNAELLAQSS